MASSIAHGEAPPPQYRCGLSAVKPFALNGVLREHGPARDEHSEQACSSTSFSSWRLHMRRLSIQ
eukprot:5774059-Pleurochrysis_carterae.AAC.2